MKATLSPHGIVFVAHPTCTCEPADSVGGDVRQETNGFTLEPPRCVGCGEPYEWRRVERPMREATNT